jgi:predicted N-acetyltransferase YhbS
MNTLAIREATADDVDAVTRVINAAFEVERFFKRGDRTSPEAIRTLMSKGTMLVATAEDGTMMASVYVELRGDRGYIGMLSVDPARQGGGLGRTLMTAAEDYCRAHGCSTADISVVNLRTELPPLYARLGYVEVGTAPFHDVDEATQPCHFILMAKPL